MRNQLKDVVRLVVDVLVEAGDFFEELLRVGVDYSTRVDQHSRFHVFESLQNHVLEELLFLDIHVGLHEDFHSHHVLLLMQNVDLLRLQGKGVVASEQVFLQTVLMFISRAFRNEHIQVQSIDVSLMDAENTKSVACGVDDVTQSRGLHGDHDEADLIFEVDVLEQSHLGTLASLLYILLIVDQDEVLDEEGVEGVRNGVGLYFRVVRKVGLQNPDQYGVGFVYFGEVDDQLLSQLEVMEEVAQVLLGSLLHALVPLVEELNFIHVEVFVTLAVIFDAGEFDEVNEELSSLLTEGIPVLDHVEKVQASGQVFILAHEFIHVVHGVFDILVLLQSDWISQLNAQVLQHSWLEYN